jgi:hypothetical protein
MKIKYKPKEKSIVAVATEEEVTMVFILLQMVWMINDVTHLNYFFNYKLTQNYLHSIKVELLCLSQVDCCVYIAPKEVHGCIFCNA